MDKADEATDDRVKMRCLTKRWRCGVMLEPGDPYMLVKGKKHNPKTLAPWDDPVPAPAPEAKNTRPPGAGPERKKTGPYGS